MRARPRCRRVRRTSSAWRWDSQAPARLPARSPPPRRRCVRAIALGYTEAFGPPLAARADRRHITATGMAWTCRSSAIAVTVGASGGFPLAFLAAFDPGDRVALTSPFYPPYVNILTALGMQPVILEAGPDTRFQPSVAMLERLDPPPDGLIVASPCNPAGTMLHPDELTAIAAWCDDAGVRLISDEIYHGLNYDSPIASAASVSRQCGGGQQLLEVFLDDWLADRLAGLARRPRAPGRAPGAEPVHQRAVYLAGRGRGGVRLSRRTCRRMSRVIAVRAIICCARCRRLGSPACRRPRARSICSPISPSGRTTAPRSARGCWPRSGSR